MQNEPRRIRLYCICDAVLISLAFRIGLGFQIQYIFLPCFLNWHISLFTHSTSDFHFPLLETKLRVVEDFNISQLLRRATTMSGEVIDRLNPQALPSRIPDEVLALSVKLEKIKLNDADLKGLEEFRRAANYIAAGKLSNSKTSKVTF
jgi:hypothetical protein